LRRTGHPSGDRRAQTNLISPKLAMSRIAASPRQSGACAFERRSGPRHRAIISLIRPSTPVSPSDARAGQHDRRVQNSVALCGKCRGIKAVVQMERAACPETWHQCEDDAGKGTRRGRREDVSVCQAGPIARCRRSPARDFAPAPQRRYSSFRKSRRRRDHRPEQDAQPADGDLLREAQNTRRAPQPHPGDPSRRRR
jgi:hypothetical protein